ncbi:MAG: DNA (cytosine-5-)-methyltransferase [Dehalococcoidales bacterium]|nr:DNA (cytosine-5-)-methyltransferase [Dehalococcoidales bacterium]
MSEQTRLTVAEYFAGIGLVRMGLEPCGWQVVFANDISEKKHQMYQAFFPDADSHYRIGDVFKLNPDEVPPATLATCSFPCIDLSLAGNMGGINGKHSSAFWGFVRILKAQGEASPPLVMVENVPGWLHSNKGVDFRLTVQALNDLGYACDVFTMDALRFTPQSRLRVFLIGAKEPPSSQDPRSILERPSSLLPGRVKEALLANSDSRWFDSGASAPPPLRQDGLAEIVEPMEDTDERWWPKEEVKRHLAMMAESHYQRVAELIAKEKISYRTFYRRIRNSRQRAEVRSDEIAGCLRTAIGGSGRQFLIRAGQGSIMMRTMTPREYARLQGVPDDYPITVNGVQALTGFGDAVCVPVITWIARQVLGPLASQEPAISLRAAECLTT